MKRWFCLIAVAGLAGCDLNLTDIVSCDYSREFTQGLDATGIAELLADTEAGDLHIQGHSGSNEVVVHARACASNSQTLHDIDFDLGRTADRAELTTYVPHYDNARLDLTVDIPRDFDVEIYDTSGDITVRDIDGDLTVWRDTSGRIDYSNVRGEVRLP